MPVVGRRDNECIYVVAGDDFAKIAGRGAVFVFVEVVNGFFVLFDFGFVDVAKRDDLSIWLPDGVAYESLGLSANGDGTDGDSVAGGDRSVESKRTTGNDCGRDGGRGERCLLQK